MAGSACAPQTPTTTKRLLAPNHSRHRYGTSYPCFIRIQHTENNTDDVTPTAILCSSMYAALSTSLNLYGWLSACIMLIIRDWIRSRALTTALGAPSKGIVFAVPPTYYESRVSTNSSTSTVRRRLLGTVLRLTQPHVNADQSRREGDNILFWEK